jgi:hypothetical protein
LLIQIKSIKLIIIKQIIPKIRYINQYIYSQIRLNIFFSNLVINVW